MIGFPQKNLDDVSSNSEGNPSGIRVRVRVRVRVSSEDVSSNSEGHPTKSSDDPTYPSDTSRIPLICSSYTPHIHTIYPSYTPHIPLKYLSYTPHFVSLVYLSFNSLLHAPYKSRARSGVLCMCVGCVLMCTRVSHVVDHAHSSRLHDGYMTVT